MNGYVTCLLDLLAEKEMRMLGSWLDIMVKQGIDLRITLEDDETFLSLAVKAGCKKTIQKLIGYKVEVLKTLHRFIVEGDISTVKLLLDLEVNIEALTT